MRRRGLLVPVLAVAILVGGLASGVTPAFADNPSCNNSSSDFSGYDWVRSSYDVAGVRAPLNFRGSGTLCEASNGNPWGYTGDWIGIQGVNAFGHGAVAQIGFVHWLNPVTGNLDWCKFWENFPNPPHGYDCGDTNNDTYTYFRVDEYPVSSPSGTLFYYNIDDCGTSGGYDPNCHHEDSGIPAYTNPFGLATAEAVGLCNTQIMGSGSSQGPTDPQEYGNASYPLEGRVAGTWAQRTFTHPTGPTTCSEYERQLASAGPRTWDADVP